MDLMPIIVTQNLTKVYRVHRKAPGLIGSIRSLFRRDYQDILAVDRLSLTVEEGEFIGYIGPNGSGKTTTLKMLTGVLYPTAGTASVFGMRPWERSEEFLRRIAFVMGNKSQLQWNLPAMESFLLNKEIYGLSKAEFQTRLDELVELLNLQSLLSIQVRRLSLGERMKCELAAALLHRPALVFLDEPTIGLDVVSKRNLREFLIKLNREEKVTFMLTSHYLEDIKELASRVMIINHGRILFDGSPLDLLRKYAPYKVLTIRSQKPLPAEWLAEREAKIGEEGMKAILTVPEQCFREMAKQILENLDVFDLLIEEPSVEDVVVRLLEDKQCSSVTS